METRMIGRALGEAFEWLDQSADAYGVYLEDELAFSQALETLERDHDVKLSPAAVLLLAVPVLERIEARERAESDVPQLQLPDRDMVENTLDKIVAGAAKDPTGFDEQINAPPDGSTEPPGRWRTTLAIIKQFWKHFCDMPPFCGPTEHP